MFCLRKSSNKRSVYKYQDKLCPDIANYWYDINNDTYYVSLSNTPIILISNKKCMNDLCIENDSAQWGKWSEWSPCSTTCYGGTRNRYRTCDSPPPKYGAKFCEVIKCSFH